MQRMRLFCLRMPRHAPHCQPSTGLSSMLSGDHTVWGLSPRPPARPSHLPSWWTPGMHVRVHESAACACMLRAASIAGRKKIPGRRLAAAPAPLTRRPQRRPPGRRWRRLPGPPPVPQHPRQTPSFGGSCCAQSRSHACGQHAHRLAAAGYAEQSPVHVKLFGVQTGCRTHPALHVGSIVMASARATCILRKPHVKSCEVWSAMATRGPAKMSRPSTLYSSGPHSTVLSWGHRLNISATCATWQKRTAFSGDSKTTSALPCTHATRCKSTQSSAETKHPPR